MFKKNFLLVLFAVYQFFSILFIVIGFLPANVIYLNLFLQLLLILFLDPEYALLSVIISIPFFVALPTAKYDHYQIWKFVLSVLFLVFLWKQKILDWHGKFDWRKINFFTWDRELGLLILVAIISILFSSAPFAGIKKLLFVVNLYLLYVVALNLWKTKDQIRRAVIAAFASSATIVMLGFLQFFSSFASNIYYFWSYWATFVSKIYYGTELYNSLLYSNSWFTSSNNGKEPALRMFSVLPDSHAFAVIAMFSIPLAIALANFSVKRWEKVLLWIYIALADLAIILSGTKGVWVGLLAAVLICAYLTLQKYGRRIIRPTLIATGLFVLLFALSPFLQKGIASIRAGRDSGDFLSRAESLYNLNDFSNAARIMIWKKVLVYSFSHPLVGAGFGNFQEVISPQQDQLTKIFNLPAKYITAHNLYLGILAETGIFGLLALVWYFKKILQTCWKFFQKHHLYFEDPYPILLISLGVIFGALMFYSLFDETLFNDRVLMFFFVDLALAAAIIKQYE